MPTDSCAHVHRQLIPGLRTRHSKCTGAKVRDRGGDNEVATTSGSESLSAADGCDWSTEVGDVRRCQSMQRLVRQQTEQRVPTRWGKVCIPGRPTVRLYELNAIASGKPAVGECKVQ